MQNKQVGVLQMAFRARNVFGTLEKRAPGSFDRRHLDVTSLRATALDLRSEDYEPKTQTVSRKSLLLSEPLMFYRNLITN